jgi:hypothetical protein
MAAQYKSGQKSWPLLCCISIYVILRFLSAVFLRGGSWPLPPWHYVAMITDVVLLVMLIVLNSNVNAAFTLEDRSNPANSRRTLQGFLFWFGVIAAVGLLLIRFTSDAAWWTGHLR